MVLKPMIKSNIKHLVERNSNYGEFSYEKPFILILKNNRNLRKTGLTLKGSFPLTNQSKENIICYLK